MHARLEEDLRALPGVAGVTASDIPLLADVMMNGGFFIEGGPEKDFNFRNEADRHDMSRFPEMAHVGNDFISVMQIPMVAGRAFTHQDTERSPKVAIINQTLANKYFPNQNPIGRRFTQKLPSSKDRIWIQIVGICSDSRYNNLRDEPLPLHFDLYRQQADAGSMTFMIRTRMKPESIVQSITTVLHRIDSDLPAMNIRTQEQQIDDNLQQERMFASLTSGFALLAVTLALVGIYGITSYTVVQRTNEIGIRLALGAKRRHVRGIVLREAGWPATLGVVAGLAVALGMGRLVRSMLNGLQPADPVSLV